MSVRGVAAVCLGLTVILGLGCQDKPDSPSGPLWSTNLEKAIERAGNESKPVLIDFGADWCKPCKRMHTEVFVEPSVHKRLKTQFVTVLIDATEITPSVSQLLQKYRVGTLPTIVFLNARGEFLKDQSLVGFTNVDELNTRLSKVEKLVSQP